LAESWNGTSWTEVNDFNTAKKSFGANGTQTSGLVYGGDDFPLPALTESWNGTSWTEVNDLNTARLNLAGAGADNTSALAIGGTRQPPVVANTESWNGTSWTEVNDLNTARFSLGGDGSQTSAIAAGGDLSPGNSNLTEEWNDGIQTKTITSS
jgi:hypothetical protein